MANYRFPGFLTFLEAAAAQIGHPEAADPARRVAVLAAVANLCAQASDADPVHVAGILIKAEELRDQLHTAYRAADLMLDDVRAARCPETVETGLPAKPAKPRGRTISRSGKTCNPADDLS